MKTIHTEIIINTPIENVWDGLIDFKNYPSWNPFINQIIGDSELNNKLTVKITPPGKSSMTFKPTIIHYLKNRELRWLGRFLLPKLFDGEHSFKLKAIDKDNTLFIQSEKFSGVLVPLFFKSMHKATCDGFKAMNAALKVKCEISK